jgi:hypothetical protein
LRGNLEDIQGANFAFNSPAQPKYVPPTDAFVPIEKYRNMEAENR